jgi:hypothetical protein
MKLRAKRQKSHQFPMADRIVFDIVSLKPAVTKHAKQESRSSYWRALQSRLQLL